MNKTQLFKQSLMNSVGVLVYCIAVAFLMTNGQNIFGKADNVFGGVAILMLLVLSAAIVGWLVFGKSLMYYLDDKKKEAITLLSYTIGLLFVFTAIILISFAIFK
jgi:SNF family Na+-dependent transporter